jgi:hypothetical protein
MKLEVIVGMKFIFFKVISIIYAKVQASCFGEKINIIEELHNNINAKSVFLVKKR